MIAAPIVTRARAAGDHPAIICHATTVTYRQLLASASAYARAVSQLPGGAPIAVVALRQPSTIVAILGILLAGRSYLPLNPADPAARQRSILDVAGVTHTVGRELAVPEIVDDAPAWTPRQVRASDPAYTFFTSGSTGVPKGVPLTHGNAEAFVDWACRTFRLQPADRVGVYAPLFFDLSIFDLFAGLRCGATLVLVPDDVAKFSRATADYLRHHRVSVLYAVPSALLPLLQSGALPDLRLLLLAGEAFPAEHLMRLRSTVAHAALHNLYGPIESNVVAHFAVPPEWPNGEPVPIGRPAADAHLAILDDDGKRLAEAGHTGELLITGPSVFGGYLPHELMPSDPFVDVGGVRWYRTGDFANLGADGNYRFHGRRDARVKIRGYLVELAEVERALRANPQISNAAVVAAKDPDGHSIIRAFVATSLEPKQVLRWCATLLPRYMLPSHVEVLDELPLGRTGKVDRQRLAERVAS